MQHLTIDQIIDFVSICKLDAASLELSCIVNEHIRECDRCLELVNAYQGVYDEFQRLQNVGDFRSFAYSIIPESETKRIETEEIENAERFMES